MICEQRGSVLILFVPGLLIMILLIGLVVNVSGGFQRQSRVAAIADEVAHDIASAAIDEQYFQTATTSQHLAIRFDLAKAKRIADAAEIANANRDGLQSIDITISVPNGATQVLVEVTGEFQPLFAGFFNPSRTPRNVHASARTTGFTGR